MSVDAAEASVLQRAISAEAAGTACRAALARAQALGLRINVAVTDAAGTLTAFLRMPGAFLHSVEIAIDKAYTAASFGFPTARWAELVAGDELLRIGLNQRPRLVMFGGGLPIVDANGARIGAIGVSGGSAEQDEACARAGIEALGLH
ncbi:MAG: heme-binding protein [Burkholderiales bacterium]|nr:heme-binding protein [Burkholderiales bacterium]